MVAVDRIVDDYQEQTEGAGWQEAAVSGMGRDSLLESNALRACINQTKRGEWGEHLMHGIDLDPNDLLALVHLSKPHPQVVSLAQTV